jgi:tRNA modification GTPase
MKKARAMASGSAVVSISVSNRKNIGSLEKAILRSVWSGKYAQSETAIVTNARHKELLDKALGCMLSVDKAATGQGAPELMSVDLREAIDSLGLILGKSVSDDVLDRIFGRFCIGK